MRAAFRPLLWFLLPWLIILIVPQLRVMLRVQALGSEYNESEYGITPLTIWIHPLPPTARQLEVVFPGKAMEIRLKAPEKRGDDAISPQIAIRTLDAALQKPDAPLWMLAARLRGVDIQVNRVFPGDALNTVEQEGEDTSSHTFPIAGNSNWNRDEIEVMQSSPSSPPRLGTANSPIIKPLDVSQPKFALPLRLAKRGLDAEPDNAFWRVQIACFLALAQHDGEATRELLAAARCPRYDSHCRDEVRAALDVANLHRPLLWSEKLNVAARQNIRESPHHARDRDRTLLWLAGRGEKSGDLGVSAALARVAALMRGEALTNERVRHALLLQSAAWAGVTRPAHVNGSAMQRAWPQQLSIFNYEGGSTHPTPLDFARPFAKAAQKKGRADLAREALAQGRDATRIAAHLPMHWGTERLVLPLSALIPSAICDFNAQMVLLQLQFVGAAWLLLGFLLWRRMNWAWRLTARAWQIVGLIWRVRDRPLDDEAPVEITHAPRDLRRSAWFCGALVWLGAAGMTWWTGALNSWDYDFAQSHFNSDWQVPSYFLFVGGPIIGGIFWCGSAALWRYARLKAPIIPRDEPETYALHVPPSIIPRAGLVMCWCVTAGMMLSWLQWFLTRTLGPTALNFPMPRLWAIWLGQSSLDFSDSDLFLPIFLCFVTLGVWLVKWCWQLHLRRRVPALLLGLRWLRATLGVWLVLGSWLYLAFLLLALPYHHATEVQIEKIVPSMVISMLKTAHS